MSMKLAEEKTKHLFLVAKNEVSLGNDDYYRIYERIYFASTLHIR